MLCLYCESPDIKKALFPRTTYFNDKKFDYYKCTRCGLIFINPLPTDEDYARMYAMSYHDQFYFKDINRDYRVLSKLLEKNTPEKNLLDYGCGDGSLINYFAQKGYKCTGVEYEQELVEKLKNKFKNASFYTVDEFNRNNNEMKFGVIYMGDALEHLGNPSEFVKQLSLKLNENGLILIQGPLENNFTLALVYRKFISWFRAHKPASHIPYHISFSNEKNQEEIFIRNGFKTIYFKIVETPWPFPEKFSVKPMLFVKYIIARISILFSKLYPGRLGNRFIYLGKKI